MKLLVKLAVVAVIFALLATEPPRKTEAASQLNKANVAQKVEQSPSTEQQVTTQVNEIKPKAQEPVVTQPVAQTPQPQISGTKQDWLGASNIPSSEWGNVDYIITHESSWNPTAKNYLGCLGLGQACPGQKLLNVCPDLNPVCQLNFFYTYMVNRYGSAGGAVNFWKNNHWY